MTTEQGRYAGIPEPCYNYQHIHWDDQLHDVHRETSKTAWLNCSEPICANRYRHKLQKADDPKFPPWASEIEQDQIERRRRTLVRREKEAAKAAATEVPIELNTIFPEPIETKQDIKTEVKSEPPTMSTRTTTQATATTSQTPRAPLPETLRPEDLDLHKDRAHNPDQPSETGGDRPPSHTSQSSNRRWGGLENSPTWLFEPYNDEDHDTRGSNDSYDPDYPFDRYSDAPTEH